MSGSRADCKDHLRVEARLLGRLVVCRAIDEEFVERYVAAHDYLMTGPQPADQVAIVAFAVRRQWALPMLEAAAAFVAPGSLLRKKALLMAAIIEASPRHADDFLPKRSSVPTLALHLFWSGVMTAILLIVGLPIHWLIRSRA